MGFVETRLIFQTLKRCISVVANFGLKYFVKLNYCKLLPEYFKIKNIIIHVLLKDKRLLRKKFCFIIFLTKYFYLIHLKMKMDYNFRISNILITNIRIVLKYILKFVLKKER